MAKNRDVRSDPAGKPLAVLRAEGEDGGVTWGRFAADFSAVGMATDMPLDVTASAGADFLAWHFGPVEIAKTPRGATPNEAADTLEMNTLLSAFRRFVLAEGVGLPKRPGRDHGKSRPRRRGS